MPKKVTEEEINNIFEFYAIGLTYDEISEKTGRSRETVRNIISNGYSKRIDHDPWFIDFKARWNETCAVINPAACKLRNYQFSDILN